MKLVSIYYLFLLVFLPIYGMELAPRADLFNKNFELQRKKIQLALDQAISNAKKFSDNSKISERSKNLIELNSQDQQHTESINLLFEASENLALDEGFSTLQRHPLYSYFQALAEGETLSTTLPSGPNIYDFTDILLEKHELDLKNAHTSDSISMRIFNNVETFLRCLEIFKNGYRQHTGKVINVDIAYSLTHTPLDNFCKKYVANNPELAEIQNDLMEQIVNLISIFEIDNNIVNMNIKLTMAISSQADAHTISFKPIFLHLNASENNSSNDISVGQQDLNKQIQNLSGSELAMPYIKDADGQAQFKALQSILAKKSINLVEIGGGRGETNAVMHAIQKNGASINLLSIEPHEPFAETYINAHKAIGIDQVSVMQKTSQELCTCDVTNHFKGKADVIFASHSFYFILGDLHKATQAYLNGDSVEIEDHPLAKYFDMLADDGVLIVTLQSGAGARLIRNALLGNHGLDLKSNQKDKTIPLLQSFGNLATFVRHFEFFAKLYEQKTGKKLRVRTHIAVATVPFGGLKIEQKNTGEYILHSPDGLDNDTSWNGIKLMDFYGNWKELQTLASLAYEDAQVMKVEDLKKLGIEKLSKELLADKRELAIKTQQAFLHILRAFAPGLVAMLHPNITLEITVEPNNKVAY